MLNDGNKGPVHFDSLRVILISSFDPCRGE